MTSKIIFRQFTIIIAFSLLQIAYCLAQEEKSKSEFSMEVFGIGCGESISLSTLKSQKVLNIKVKSEDGEKYEIVSLLIQFMVNHDERTDMIEINISDNKLPESFNEEISNITIYDSHRRIFFDQITVKDKTGKTFKTKYCYLEVE